jgi:hypothetical protein
MELHPETLFSSCDRFCGLELEHAKRFLGLSRHFTALLGRTATGAFDSTQVVGRRTRLVRNVRIKVISQEPAVLACHRREL